MGLCSSNQNKKPIQQSQFVINQNEHTNTKQSETQLTKQTRTAVPSINLLQNNNFVKDDIDPPTPQSFMHNLNIVSDIQKSLEFKTGFFKTYSVITTNQDDKTLLCQHNKTAVLVLVYCLDPKNIQDNYFIKSIQLNQNDNVNICQFIEIFNENKTIYLIQEYCKGSKLSNLQKLDQSQILYIMSQLVSVLNQLNSNNQYHGKLTIDSFSLVNNESYNVKLTDVRTIFQQNINLQQQKEADELELYKRYQPPFENPSIKTDIFSIGMIFYQLLTHKLPSKLKIINSQQISNPLPKLENQNDPKIMKLLKSMLQLDSSKRISIQQLTQNKLISVLNNKKLIYQILDKIQNNPQINYFQTAILIYMITKFQPQESKIHKKLFQSLDQYNNKYLNKDELKQACERTDINKVEFIMAPQEFNDEIKKCNGGQISQNEFLIALCNRENLLTEDYLENSFNFLKNQNGLLSGKSISRKFFVDQNELHKDLEKVSFNGQITLNEFKEQMLLLK
ncbi:unnamed protein product [Paramecium sonneborni]|uniref:Uncharacterized protein n=1 Tax=Paramecium sonneborni TaxID=65129 RepID=A0A8S1QMV8_9CILI|nr:unnamed protein product [Paramecium sonneborni]